MSGGNHRARNLQEMVEVGVSNSEDVSDQRLSQSSNSANTHPSHDQDVEDRKEKI